MPLQAHLKSAPLISIGVPVFNGAAFIGTALDSILGQTLADFEVIISDNASTDDTETICRAYEARDGRIRYIRNERNLGAAENYNRVFQSAQGKYFKWASHDDICGPELLERCVAALERDPTLVLCYPSTIIIDHDGKSIGEYSIETSYLEPQPKQRYRRWLLERKAGECNAVFGLMPAEVLRNTGLIGKYVASDVILLGELTLRGRIEKLPDKLFYRRDHPLTSGRAHNGPDEILEWFDTSKRGGVHMPLWRWLVEYKKAVWRAPIRLDEKLACFGLLVRWSIMIRNELGRELLGALKKVLGRGPALTNGDANRRIL